MNIGNDCQGLPSKCDERVQAEIFGRKADAATQVKGPNKFAGSGCSSCLEGRRYMASTSKQLLTFVGTLVYFPKVHDGACLLV